MIVELLTYTPHPLNVMAVAALGCHSEKSPLQLWREINDGTISYDHKLRVVRNCIVRDHNTVLRHPSFTWSIEGISRACSHQLVRHAAGITFDQQSQRYVTVDNVEWVLPSNLLDGSRDAMVTQAEADLNLYHALLDAGEPEENARYSLPSACPTNLTCTANLAAVLHLYRVRFKGTTGKPQDEIKDLTHEMLRQLIEAEPWLAEFMPHIGHGK